MDPTNPVTPAPPHGPPAALPAAQPAPAPAHNYGGNADARNSAALPTRNKKEPRQFSAPSAATVNSAPPMLLGVSNLPFYTEQHYEPNTFVPSAITLFAILAELDQNMANTYRFLQSSPGWIPLVSQAYIGVCFIVHVFRVSREAGTISAEQFQFLQWFESVYDFRTLMIPGPLVPVFQSLAHISGPFEWIGNIAPSLPHDVRPCRRNAYSPSANVRYLLPHVPLIIDQIQWFIDSFNITTHNESFIPDNFYSNIFGVNAAVASFGMEALLSPNARHNVSVSTQQYRSFKSLGLNIRFPPRLGTTTDNIYMTWFEYLRFRPVGASHNTYAWFSSFSSTMQRYCQFVNGSVPMSAISLTGLGAASVTWTYQPSTDLRSPPSLIEEVSIPDANNNRNVRSLQHFAVPALTTLAAIGEHFDPELEELAEQFAAASQVNVSLTGTSGTAPFPADDVLRQGTAWSLPVIRRSPVIDVIPTHGPLIMTHYHSDARRNA